MEFSTLRASALAFAAVLAILLSTLPTGASFSGNEASSSRRPSVLSAGVSADDGWSGGDPARLARQQPGEERPWLRSVSTSPLYPWVAEPGGQAPADLPLFEPVLRVDEAAATALDQALATPGVRFATRFFLAEVRVRRDADGVDGPLLVAFVDPARFRSLTPAVTAVSEPAWRAVARGGVLLRHEVGRALGVAPGETVTLGQGPAALDAAVGAWASLGRAAVADAIAGTAAMEQLGLRPATRMLVAVDPGEDPAAVAQRLAGAGVGTVSAVPDVRPYQSRLAGSDEATVAAFEPFAFVPRSGGAIHVDPGWVERNIVTTPVPIVGEVTCHRLMIPQLRAALEEIEAAGLADLLDPGDYGGCYVPRHIDRDAARNLSMHAWGLAVDFNVHTNMLGEEPQLDPRVVEVFERHGFAWGGHWRRPDGMHFELAVLRPAP